MSGPFFTIGYSQVLEDNLQRIKSLIKKQHFFFILKILYWVHYVLPNYIKNQRHLLKISCSIVGHQFSVTIQSSDIVTTYGNTTNRNDIV